MKTFFKYALFIFAFAISQISWAGCKDGYALKNGFCNKECKQNYVLSTVGTCKFKGKATYPAKCEEKMINGSLKTSCDSCINDYQSVGTGSDRTCTFKGELFYATDAYLNK